MLDFTKHPQFLYSQNSKDFQNFRLKYYSSYDLAPNSNLEIFFFKEIQKGILDKRSLCASIDQVRRLKAELAIVTCTYNRGQNLQKLFQSLISQKLPNEICWIVVDNGSTDDTPHLISRFKNDLNILYLKYNPQFGYASPGRNRGLAFIQSALRKYARLKYYWVIDSDDYIHNEYVLKELSTISKKFGSMVVHGYALTNYENEAGKLIAQNTIPRNVFNNFPSVRTLKDEFELGPQILSSLIDCNLLPNLYYPDEFTMEDDALNQKMMCLFLKRKLKVTAIDFPCLVKTFHQNSMSATNNRIGKQELKVDIGPMTVSGIRAEVVTGLLHLRDFFTRENL